MKRSILYLFSLMATLLVAFSTPAMADESEPLEFIEASPADSATYSFTSYEGAVSFRFSVAVEVDSSVIVLSNGRTYPITDFSTSDFFYHYYNCNPSSILKALHTDGSLQAGEYFGIKLYGVRAAENPTNILNDDGILEVHYKACGIPSTLTGISPEDGSVLESYYAPAAEEGIITFSFNGAITAVSNAYVYYGDREKGTYNQIDVPFSFEENEVKVDLRDLDMSRKALNGDSIISMKVSGIYGIGGQMIEGNAPGSPGAVTASFRINKKTATSVYGGFEGNIDDAYLECWISDTVTYDAVRFNFSLAGKDAEADIPAAMTSITPEPDPSFPKAILIRIDLSEMTFDAGKVTVSLLNCQTVLGATVAISSSFTSKGRQAAATACIGITPMPGIIDALPESFTFSFNDSIEIEEAVRSMPLCEDATLDPIVECNKVTFLNNRNASLNGRFTYSFRAKDTKGNYITYGDREGYITAEYNIPIDHLICTEITPDTTLTADSLYQFTLTFSDRNDPEKSVTIGGFNPAAAITLTDEEGNIVATGTLTHSEDETRKQDVVITLSDVITQAGTYRLSLPELSLFDELYDNTVSDFGISWGTTCNAAASFSFSVSGVLGIREIVNPMTIRRHPIYNTQGIQVGEYDPAHAPSDLKSGIYLMNGKKIQIK